MSPISVVLTANMLLKSSRKKKDLNDVTAASSKKNPPKTGQL